MKPKTKLQKAVVKSMRKLSPLSEYQRKEAIKQIAPHIAKLNSKGEYTCMDCGYSWKGEKAENITCPHCLSKLQVETDRKRKHTINDYFMVITKCNGFQVLRMFFITTKLCKGESANWWIGEVFQRWITSEGKGVIVSRSHYFSSYYCDLWDWNSDLEIRNECRAHSIEPYKIIGRVNVIPELTRNGFKGDFHNCSPNSLIKGLLSDNRIETLWKVGQIKLVENFTISPYKFYRYWSEIKIAIRHHYMIKDATMWYDLLGFLSELDKDIHNPKLICPVNLKEAHDYWLQKIQAKREREYRQQERERLLNEEQRYLQDLKQVAKEEAEYKKAKSQFFDLVFNDGELTIKPLTSVKEFVEEGHLMHHCVFARKYYKDDKALILHAIIDNVSVATIEINLDNLKIVQCRGIYNSVPSMQGRIIALIEENKNKIAQKLAA